MFSEGTEHPAAFAAQRHHLPAGDADVAVAAGRLIAPAAGVVRVLGQVLRQEDQLDGAGQGRAAALGELGVGGHADDLGEHQRADAVAIHRAVARVRDEQAVGALVVEDVADALFDRLAIRPRLAGDVPGGQVRHHRQRRDRGRPAEPARLPGAVGLLSRLQILERPADRRVGRGWCHCSAAPVPVRRGEGPGPDGRRKGQDGQRHQPRQASSTAVES